MLITVNKCSSNVIKLCTNIYINSKKRTVQVKVKSCKGIKPSACHLKTHTRGRHQYFESFSSFTLNETSICFCALNTNYFEFKIK